MSWKIDDSLEKAIIGHTLDQNINAVCTFVLYLCLFFFRRGSGKEVTKSLDLLCSPLNPAVVSHDLYGLLIVARSHIHVAIPHMHAHAHTHTHTHMHSNSQHMTSSSPSPRSLGVVGGHGPVSLQGYQVGGILAGVYHELLGQLKVS